MTNAQRAYGVYQTVATQTASQDRILIMLYDGLIQSLRLAEQYITSNQVEASHKQLVKAQEIVMGLHSTLEMDYDISKQLAAIYDYFYRRLVAANVDKVVEPVQEVLAQVIELRDAWVEAARVVRESASQKGQGQTGQAAQGHLETRT